ncbi:MAG: hypothetical protein ACXVKK_14385, partial [Flavisolibacter sp.]
MKRVIIRSGVSDLKPFEHQTLPKRRFVIGKLPMSECTASNRLELFVTFSFQEKKKISNLPRP